MPSDQDVNSISELYEQYSDQICRFLLRHTSDPVLAEDLTGEVFLRAWQNRSKLLVGNRRAWLYRVARNLTTDHWRRKQPVSLEAASEIKTDYDLVAETEKQDELRTLRQLVFELPLNLRFVIELRFFEQLPIQETAVIIGKSEGATRVLQHRALRRLRKMREAYDKK